MENEWITSMKIKQRKQKCKRTQMKNDKIIFTLNLNWGKNIHNFSFELIIKTKHIEKRKKKSEARNGLHWWICILHTHERLCKQLTEPKQTKRKK